MHPILVDNIPIIIGTGIAGLAISKKLSNNKIEHALIGAPRSVTRPILGESVEMLGCTILNNLFPNLSQYFYPKMGINYHLQDSICHFDFNRCFQIPEIIQLMEHTKYPHKINGQYGLIHIDRAEFDVMLFEQVIQSPHCHYIDSLINNIEYCAKEDRIQSVALDDGTTIHPIYIFDATNTACLLAKAMKLERIPLTEKLRVVYTHYKTNKDNVDLKPADQPWANITNIYRHYADISGFQGSSWCIPIGDHISIGTNIVGDVIQSDEEILSITNEVYKSRGVDYRAVYCDDTEIRAINTQLYYYSKIFGSNWVLTAGAASLTWYTAQTGVESSMFVANVADRIIQQPQYYGQYYQEFVMQQVKMHKIHDWLHFHPIHSVNEKNAHEYMINSIRNIQGRYLMGNLSLDHPLLNKYAWISDIEKYRKPLADDELKDIIAMVKRGETCADYLYV